MYNLQWDRHISWSLVDDGLLHVGSGRGEAQSLAHKSGTERVWSEF